MRWLLDDMLPLRAAVLLHDLGHDAVSVLGLGLAATATGYRPDRKNTRIRRRPVHFGPVLPLVSVGQAVPDVNQQTPDTA